MMIRRQHPDAPHWFFQHKKTIQRQHAINQWLKDRKQSLWTRWPWQDIEDFMEQFRPLFDNKCIYCEVLLTSPIQPRVNLFRPYEYARHERDDEARSDKDHYRWLSWDWSNLYLCCDGCAKAKGSIFPTLAGQRMPLGTDRNKFDAEIALLLDPCNNDINPLCYLSFQEDGIVIAQPGQNPDYGAITTEVLNLNRPGLANLRLAAIQKLYTLCDTAIQLINDEQFAAFDQQIDELMAQCADHAEFAGMKRQLLYRWSQSVTHSALTNQWARFIEQLQDWNENPQKQATSDHHRGSSSTQFDQGYALLIGVGANRYNSDLSLPVTVNDAVALQKILSDPQRCAYPPDQIRVLYNEKASKHDILDGLAWLAHQAVHKDATVFIFFSGHGAWDSIKNKYYLLPYDYQHPYASQTALSAQEFHQALNTIPAKKVLVILDCCHAGGVARGKTAIAKAVGEVELQVVAPPPELIQMLKEGEGRAIISSSRDREESFIQRYSANSLFTSELIKALNGDAQINRQDGTLWLFDLVAYLNRHVPARARALNATQTPIFNATDLTDFPIALLQQPKPVAPVEIHDSEKTGIEQAGSESPKPQEPVVATVPPKPSIKVNTSTWRDLLTECFDDNELRTLCFDLGIDYESLPALGKAGKVRELVLYVKRHGLIETLLSECRRLRNHIDWSVVTQLSLSKHTYMIRKRKKPE